MSHWTAFIDAPPSSADKLRRLDISSCTPRYPEPYKNSTMKKILLKWAEPILKLNEEMENRSNSI